MCLAASAADDWRSDAFSNLESRDWPTVEEALAAAVRGTSPLPGDDNGLAVVASEAERAAAAAGRVTWRLEVAYYGPAFSGFEWQPESPKPTVQACLQDAIGSLQDGRSELRLSCAGRTDAGVSSVGQLVSFHASAELRPSELAAAVARASPEPGALRLVSARRAPSDYHATYSTSWRRYVYFLPAEVGRASLEAVAAEASRIDNLLRPLAGETRDYAALGRSLPAGKETRTLLRYASARPVELRRPYATEERAAAADGVPTGVPTGAPAWATRIELVGDRFLRRQVRTTVATAAAIAAGHLSSEGEPPDTAPDERLLRVSTSGRPELTAREAPACGLVFVGECHPSALRVPSKCYLSAIRIYPAAG